MDKVQMRTCFSPPISPFSPLPATHTLFPLPYFEAEQSEDATPKLIAILLTIGSMRAVAFYRTPFFLL
jgi:hypothetical protein